MFCPLWLLPMLFLVAWGFPREPLSSWLNDREKAISTKAVLLASSNSWLNYRHQADACHAYQVLVSHGIPKENIVTMMYDDIAYNKQNPRPGVIINEPGGPNVYKGVNIDYSGKGVHSEIDSQFQSVQDLTPDNFISVLQGDTKAVTGVGSGRVLESDANTNVFIYIVDHGGRGFIIFPNHTLTAKELNDALLNMHANGRYKQMTIYVETCFAGSMFVNYLENNINVYVMTAANSTQGSSACCWSHQIKAYVADLFSISWLKDADACTDTEDETLEQQYLEVKAETTKSNVSQYGQLDIAKEPLAEFIGYKREQNKSDKYIHESTDTIPNGDVPIAVLSHLIFETDDQWLKEEHEKQLIDELIARQYIRQTIRSVVKGVVNDESIVLKLLTVQSEPTQFDCIKKAIKSFSEHCFNINKFNYATQLLYSLVNLCEAYPLDSILDTMDMTCRH